MEKKTVLLYSPKTQDLENVIPRSPPLTLLSLAGLLLKHGYEVKIFDALVDKDAKDKILENLDNALCLGCSVWTGYPITDCLELSKKVKNIKPDFPIIWGGWHPSLCAKQTLENPLVDIAIRGQGEETLLEVVQCLKRRQPLENVLGITYRSGNKTISNPDRPRVALNDLPPPPYHLIDVEKYINDVVGERTIGYISSQGCPFNCAFCADAMVYKRRRMELSAERVLIDMKNLIENYKVDSFMFEDTNFFVDKKKVMKICQGILGNGWDIKWTAFERANHFLTFSEEEITLIKRSGCKLLVVGAESGSQRILDSLNKGLKVEETVAFTKLCKKNDIGIRFDFIVGLPNETVEDFRKTLNLIKTVYRINNNNELHLPFYTPYPGTPLYDLVIKKYGFKEPKSLEEWAEYDPHIVEMKWVSKKYREEVHTFLFYLQLASLNEHFTKRIDQAKFKLPYLLMHKISSLRVENNFFKFPIEKKAYNLFKKFLK